LAAGADPEYKDYSNTALHISAETESNTEVWATLLNKIRAFFLGLIFPKIESKLY